MDDSAESMLSDLSQEEAILDLKTSPKLDISTAGRSNAKHSKASLSQTGPAELEDIWSHEDSLDEDEISEMPVPRSKRIKINHRTSLPPRTARDSANKSIKDRTSRRILDSEDSDPSDHSDDVSHFGSDIVSDEFDDSEDANGGSGNVVGVAVLTARNPSSAPITNTAISSRGSRRRGAPSVQTRNPTRGRRSWQSRVEDRVSSEVP